MIKIEIKRTRSEFDKFSKNLLKLTGQGEYKRQYLDGCADYMIVGKGGMRDRAFNKEEDPTTGEAWADLAPATQAERAEEGYQPNTNKLRRTGQLRDWIQKKINSESFVVGTNVPYATQHQTTGVGQKKIKRRFLGISEIDFRGFNLVFKRILQKIERMAKGTE